MFQKIELRPINHLKHDLLIKGKRLATIGLATIALSLGIPQCSTKIAEVTSTPTIVTPTFVPSVTTTATATATFEEPTSTATVTDVPKTVTPTRTPTPTEILIPTLTPSPTVTEVLPTPTETIPPLGDFVEQCKAAGKDAACIHSEGVLALHLKMGDGKMNVESDIPFEKGVARLWNEAWKGEVVGILAHENFEGQKFFKLSIGDVVSLIWSDGTIERYLISEKTMWRCEDNKAFFLPWDGRGDKISTQDLAKHYYIGGENHNRMVLQTCINVNEGVLFVVAYRVK